MYVGKIYNSVWLSDTSYIKQQLVVDNLHY